MADLHHEKIKRSLTRFIKGATRTVTVLFTDIEDSSAFWEKVGDVRGRLMMDQHNRAVFPVIDKFNGRIVKTIGDAIMASFKKPAQAVRAAVAIQQLMKKEEIGGEAFPLKIRIGIHTGEAIVEHNDVYGDVVNVASRIEQECRGGGILLSKDTADHLKKKEFKLSGKRDFIPKGKSTPLTVLNCEWERFPDLVSGIQSHSIPRIIWRQRGELFLYAAASAGLLTGLYRAYARFFLGDLRGGLITITPWVRYLLWFLIASASAFLAFALLKRLRHHPFAVLSGLRGGFGALLGFLMVFLPATFLPTLMPSVSNHELFRLENTFLEILREDVSVRQSPSFGSDVIQKVQHGELLVLRGEVLSEKVVWSKVPAGPGLFGWVVRTVPAKIGVPEKRISAPVRFVFYARDCAALILGFAGFVWGFLTFKIRPV